jgi:hypothetical protein
LVTRVGWYADMPADTALFVRPEREVSDIRQHLRDFLAAPESFAATGARGREILETQHAPEIYADALLELARQVCGWRGRVWAYDFAPHAAALAAPLHTTASLDFAQEKTAREIALLAGWEKPSMADYAPITLMRQPAAPQATWRERLQAHLDRWFLGASVD